MDAIASFSRQVSTCTARSAYNVLTAPIGVCSSARLVKYMLAAQYKPKLAKIAKIGFLADMATFSHFI